MRRILFFSVPLLLGVASCKVFDQPLTFSISRGFATIEVPPSLGVPDSTWSPPLSPIYGITFAQDFTTNGTSAEKITASTLTKLIFYIDTAKAKVPNFSFLKWATVSIGGRGLSPVVIASIDSSLHNVDKLEFTVTKDDLARAVKNDSVTISIRLKFRTSLADTARFHCFSVFQIIADPL